MLGYLAWARYSPIIQKDAYTKYNILTEAVGTGPYKLVEFVPNDRVVYTRNPDFWKPGMPYINDMSPQGAARRERPRGGPALGRDRRLHDLGRHGPDAGQ